MERELLGLKKVVENTLIMFSNGNELELSNGVVIEMLEDINDENFWYKGSPLFVKSVYIPRTDDYIDNSITILPPKDIKTGIIHLPYLTLMSVPYNGLPLFGETYCSYAILRINYLHITEESVSLRFPNLTEGLNVRNYV